MDSKEKKELIIILQDVISHRKDALRIPYSQMITLIAKFVHRKSILAIKNNRPPYVFLLGVKSNKILLACLLLRYHGNFYVRFDIFRQGDFDSKVSCMFDISTHFLVIFIGEGYNLDIFASQIVFVRRELRR